MMERFEYLGELPELTVACADLDHPFQFDLLEWDTTPMILREQEEKSLKAFCLVRDLKPAWAMRWMKLPEYQLAREILSKAKGERDMRHRIVLDVLEAKAQSGDLAAMKEFRALYPEKLTAIEKALEAIEEQDIREISLEELERLEAHANGGA